jgi:hypothetical protein
MHQNSYSQFGLRGRAPRGVTGELSPASVYVSLQCNVIACETGFADRKIYLKQPQWLMQWS